jgi:hypothetical protein
VAWESRTNAEIITTGTRKTQDLNEGFPEITNFSFDKST